jgi:archaellum component FlaC
MEGSYRSRATLQLLVSALIIVLACADRVNAQPGASSSDKRVAELSERVKALESQLQVLSQNWEKSSSLRDTEYILRIQRQYEAYYEKAFNTQQYTIWAIGLFLTVILALAGRFGLQVFDRHIEYTVKGVASELRASFEQRLESETSALRTQNAQRVSEGIENLQKKYDQALEDLTDRSGLRREFDSGLIFASLKQYDDAADYFHQFLTKYLKARTRNLVRREDAASVISNLFKAIYKKDPDKFQDRAPEELKNNIYRELSEELVSAASLFAKLAPFLSSQDPVQGAPEQS